MNLFGSKKVEGLPKLKKGMVFLVDDGDDGDDGKPFVVTDANDFGVRIIDLLKPVRAGWLQRKDIPTHNKYLIRTDIRDSNDFETYLTRLKQNAPHLKDAANADLVATFGGYNLDFLEYVTDCPLFRKVTYLPDSHFGESYIPGFKVQLSMFNPVLLGLVEDLKDVPVNGADIKSDAERRVVLDNFHRVGIEYKPPRGWQGVRFYSPNEEHAPHMKISYPLESGQGKRFESILEARKNVFDLVQMVNEMVD